MFKFVLTASLVFCFLIMGVDARPPASARIDIRSKFKNMRNESPADNTPTASVPSKWFQNARGYDKALLAQKDLGIDIFVYFSGTATSNEKGLCNWFDNKGLKSLPVRKYLRQIIKVKIVLPGNPKNQALAEVFGVRKTPAVYMVHPDGKQRRCSTFTWDNKRPELPDPKELVTGFQLESSTPPALPAE